MRDTLADRVRQTVVATHIEPARRRGDPTVSVRVGDVERQLLLDRRAPAVCSALTGKRFLVPNQLEIEALEGPPSGQGSNVVITYRLCAAASANAAVQSPSLDSLASLRGLLSGMYDEDGGGEAWLRKERAGFGGIEGES